MLLQNLGGIVKSVNQSIISHSPHMPQSTESSSSSTLTEIPVVSDVMRKSQQLWPSLVSSRMFEKSFGICILLLYLRFVSILFQSSSPSSSLSTPLSFPSSIHAWLVLGCSFLNLISHTAVITNLLNDGLVLSILVGVTFDVASSLLYLWCFRNHLQLVLQWSSILLFWSIGNLAVHVRALFLYTSWDNMKSVVTSATNNLQGKPGPFGLDHVFAYSDTGNHLAYFLLAVRKTMGNDSLPRTAVLSSFLLVPTMILLHRYMMSEEAKSNTTTNTSTTVIPRKTPSARLAVLHQQHQRPVCDCQACRCQTSFSIAPRFCDLWFCTFQELLGKIEEGRKIAS